MGPSKPVARMAAFGYIGPLLRRALTLTIALAVYLFLALVMFASAWRDPFVYGIGIHPGDRSLYIWGFTWIPYALAHGSNPFFSDYADYPAGVNILWNTMVPVAAVLLWPIRATLGPLFAYNLLATLAPALSAFTAFVLLRRYVTRPVAAGIGGLLYGFSPYVSAQSIGHVAITLVVLPPLILLVIDEIVRVQCRSPIVLGAVLALLCVVQFFISEEVLVTTGIMTVILVVIAAALWPRELPGRAGRAVTALLTGAGLFAALIAWPVSFQLFGPQHLSVAPHTANVYVNDLLAFWVPSRIQWIAPDEALAVSGQFTGNAAEFNSYLGVPLTLLLLFSVIRWWHNGWVRLAMLAGTVVAILSLGITLHIGGSVKAGLPVFILALAFLLVPGIPARALVLLTFGGWLVLWRLPLLNSVLPARLGLFGYLSAALPLAVFVDALAGLGWRRLAMGLGVLFVALMPLTPRLPYWYSEMRAPPFFTAGGQVARVPQGSVALVAPVATIDDANIMFWQATAEMRYRMPEGYMIVPGPPGRVQINSPASATTDALIDIEHGGASRVGDEGLRRSIRSDLTAWNAQTVIVGPMANQDAAVSLLTWAIGRPPEQVEGVFVWWDVPNDT